MSDDRNRFGDFEDYGRREGNRDDYTYSSARDYAAAGRLGGDDRNFRGGGTGYSGGEYRAAQGYGGDRDRGNRSVGGGGGAGRGGGEPYRGSYGHDGQRFTESGGREDYSRTGSWGGNEDWQRGEGHGGAYERSYGGSDRGLQQRQQQQRGGGRDHEEGRGGFFGGSSGGGMFGGGGGGRERERSPSGGQQGQGRQPQGYNYQERGFFDRAGDEVRSWFGDEEAERRREYDQRQDEAMGGGGRGSAARDDHYHSWRREQISQLDRDYDEYRREHGQKFSNEFGTWRNERQTQRDCLNRVHEHMEVVGSDGQHVGTVDKVRGDRIILTKNDAEAGGRHHSIPSRWLQSVDDKVTIRKTADEAKREWRDEERNSAFFGDEQDRGGARTTDTRHANATDTARGMQARQTREEEEGEVDLNRSFSGTYKP